MYLHVWTTCIPERLKLEMLNFVYAVCFMNPAMNGDKVRKVKSSLFCFQNPSRSLHVSPWLQRDNLQFELLIQNMANINGLK